MACRRRSAALDGENGRIANKVLISTLRKRTASKLLRSGPRGPLFVRSRPRRPGDGRKVCSFMAHPPDSTLAGDAKAKPN